jgi:hypothetical protein
MPLPIPNRAKAAAPPVGLLAPRLQPLAPHSPLLRPAEQLLPLTTAPFPSPLPSSLPHPPPPVSPPVSPTPPPIPPRSPPPLPPPLLWSPLLLPPP